MYNYNEKEKLRKNKNSHNCCNSYVYAFGIPGPTGPQGPSTIKVGKTTTLNPSEQASVTNTGTDENVILDFSIPQGKAPDFKIGKVVTGAPGENAVVTLTETLFSKIKKEVNEDE